MHVCVKCLMYCIAENVGGRKHWRIWPIDLQSPKFSPSKNPILILQILWRAEFTKVLYSKQSEELNLLMFSSANVFCYTVIMIVINFVVTVDTCSKDVVMLVIDVTVHVIEYEVMLL